MLANGKRNVGDILQNADIGNEEDLENIARVFDNTAQRVELWRNPFTETFSDSATTVVQTKIINCKKHRICGYSNHFKGELWGKIYVSLYFWACNCYFNF